MTAKKGTTGQLPPMELAIMHVLWDRGSSTVQEVQEQLKGDPAYTTVQTILNTMAHKGRSKRTLKGKAFVYRAALARDTALGNAVKDLIQRTFQGSVEDLLMNLVKTEQIDAGALKRIEAMLAKEAER